ncbi:MAG TPA: phosphoserine phosphatase SerB [Caulobacteraceae bacterium]|jgi:phosphoserine phosphatase|nr:phosphoserine phosphatase SerB [Caulobacteraceae bacterium]
MRTVLTVVVPDYDTLQEVLPQALEAVARAGSTIEDTDILGDGAFDIFFDHDDPTIVRAKAEDALERDQADICVQLAEHRKKRLLIADMDSTIVGVECLDQLADFAGVGREVAQITERAMRGELEFEDALRERVAMIAGLPLGDLQRCFDERVTLNPGARTLVATMAANGARCVLVSGGFDFFTSRVAQAAGFQAHWGNKLIDDGEALTGRVAEPILGRGAKLATLRAEAAGFGASMADTLAVGDGANDVDMITAAGLGVAYRAKPVLASQADARLDKMDLTALLYFQGYGADRFVTG